MDYTVILNLILVLTIIIITRISLKINNTNNNLLQQINLLEKKIFDEFSRNRNDNLVNQRELREEVNRNINIFNESIINRVNENTKIQLDLLNSFANQLQSLTQINETKLDKMRQMVETQLKELQLDNNSKIEEMRKTVDEKLNTTLERRLGESFNMVSARLEQVHKGIGEMQSLANGVGDLKRVLTNVKTRGLWGEIQLGNILEQLLTIDQYESNVNTNPHTKDRVEFALKLPGKSVGVDNIWLPIDAKFPQEDYQRLLDAQEKANIEEIDKYTKALENRVKLEAKTIAEKYICLPYTTDFAILFLPTEGLYAEILRIPYLCDLLIREYKIIIAGPTTLSALLNSLQMGFRTLAIEKRSSEVWEVLGAVKTEFNKFGQLLEKTHKKLQEASNSIDTAAKKTRNIERKLKNVEEVSAENSEKLLND